jgi:hypothetical protein
MAEDDLYHAFCSCSPVIIISVGAPGHRLASISSKVCGHFAGGNFTNFSLGSMLRPLFSLFSVSEKQFSV